MKKLIIFILSMSICLGAASRKVKYRRYSPIAGSVLSMSIQNQEIDRLMLPRIYDDNQLHQLEKDGELVKLENTNTVNIASHISEDRRYIRPWTAQFVYDMSRPFYGRFHKPITINSAVRTIEQQRELRKHNRLAASEDRSSHIAGITIDLCKRCYSSKERKWIVSYLKQYRDMGLICVADEPTNYHVAVLYKYVEE